MHRGRVVFGAMDEVVFGHPAAEAIVAQMDRLGAARGFLMVSGTLNRQTAEIEKIRSPVGLHCASHTSWPTGRVKGSAFRISADQMRTVRSCDAVATLLPSGLSLAMEIGPSWMKGSVWE